MQGALKPVTSAARGVLSTGGPFRMAGHKPSEGPLRRQCWWSPRALLPASPVLSRPVPAVTLAVSMGTSPCPSEAFSRMWLKS